MTHEGTAHRLGIGHERISLLHNAKKRAWRNPNNLRWGSVESAALGLFIDKGWSGFSGEGGLILNLIKTMSFKTIPLQLRHTYIEAIYAQNVAFEEDRYDTKTLLHNVRSATKKQVVRNFNRMTDWDPSRFRFGSTLAFSPKVKRSHLLGLVNGLGNEAILQIAEIFARDPYTYRTGWPDLTLWRGTQVAFKEVKAPGDSLRPSQRTIIKEMLIPLGLDVSIVDVGIMS